jgi:GGDEF domain-containing protein
MVSTEQRTPRRRPPRPVADAPVDALLGRTDELTKGWLVALLEQGELEDAPAILAADVVRDGPRLCDAMVRALAHDDDLRRLQPGGALERLASHVGELAGASQVAASVRAVDALTAVIWSALREELVRPDADHVAALAERLALVSELVRAAVLRRFGAEPPRAVSAAREIAEPAPHMSALGGEAEESAPPRPSASRLSGAGRSRVSADSLWRGALADEVARARRSGAKLALLLAETSDADPVSVVEPVHVASETFGRFAQAVRSALRREDILACETEHRAWIIARTTGRTGARTLGSRITTAVEESKPWRGAPQTVGIGIAILGEDAHDAAGLIEAAEDWTFAAVATADASGAPDDSVVTGPHAVD